MEKPGRIQRKRTKGWRMPENTVYVGRPTKWGNLANWRDWLDDARSLSWYLPWPVERERWAREQSIEEFRAEIAPTLAAHMGELRGKNLACWCPHDQPCHADVLLELANRPNPKD